jgi:hypothetical protein
MTVLPAIVYFVEKRNSDNNPTLGYPNERHSGYSEYSEVNKIIIAKDFVRNNLLNYPETANFHDLSTSVHGNNINLKVTAKNAYGTPETYRITVVVSGNKVIYHEIK